MLNLNLMLAMMFKLRERQETQIIHIISYIWNKNDVEWRQREMESTLALSRSWILLCMLWQTAFFIKNLAANQPIKNALYLTNQTAFLIKNLAANQPNKVIVIAYTPDFFQNTAKWPIYHVNDLFWGNVSYIQRVPCAHALNLGRINEIQRQLKIFAD
jgi:hypothetical protein